MKSDTIAAVATAMSPSGIGIIRLSGDESLDIIDKIYRSKMNKKKISECASHTIHYGYIYDGEEMIDEVIEQYPIKIYKSIYETEVKYVSASQ